MIVSHDRVFLDETTSDTLHVSGAARKLTQSRANYSTWAQRREQQQLTHSREVESKSREIKELRDFNPATLGSTPKAMKIVKMKQKQADKLEEELSHLVRARAGSPPVSHRAQTPPRWRPVPRCQGHAVRAPAPWRRAHP